MKFPGFSSHISSGCSRRNPISTSKPSLLIHLKLSKGGIKSHPRAKPLICKRRHTPTLHGETLHHHDRKNKVPVQPITGTENSANDMDELATKFGDALNIFDEYENEQINLPPKSDFQIQPEAVCFSMDTQLELLNEMENIGSQMMKQEDNIPLGLREDVERVQKTGINAHWKSWKTCFSRYGRNNLSKTAHDIDFTDDTPKDAAHSFIQPSERFRSPMPSRDETVVQQIQNCSTPTSPISHTRPADPVWGLSQKVRNWKTQQHTLFPQQPTPPAPTEQIHPNEPLPNISRAILIPDDPPPPPPPSHYNLNYVQNSRIGRIVKNKTSSRKDSKPIHRVVSRCFGKDKSRR